MLSHIHVYIVPRQNMIYEIMMRTYVCTLLSSWSKAQPDSHQQLLRKGIRSVTTYRARRGQMAKCYSRRDKISVRQLPWQRGWGWGGGLLTTCSMTTCRRAPITHAYLQHVLGRKAKHWAQYISTSAVYLIPRITACWCFMCLDGPKQ